jgi:type II secretory pathway component PulF
VSSVLHDNLTTARRVEDRAVLPSGDGLELFHKSLAELCRAEVPLPKALRMLHDDLQGSALAEQTEAMAQEVETGATFAEVYERRKQLFPGLYRSLVEIGLHSGDLPGILDEIASHAALRQRLVQRIRKALAYPFFAATTVAITGVALLLFVAPTFVELQEKLAGDAIASPSLPRGIAVLAVSALLVFLVWLWRFSRNPLNLGARRLPLPFVERLRKDALRASFSSTLAVLLRRQLPLPKAFALAAAATDDRWARQRVEQMANAADSGAALADSVEAGELISPTLLWLLRKAEATGTVGETLTDLAAIFSERLDRSVDRLCTVVAPAAELFIGLVLVCLMLLFMFPAMRAMSFTLGF